MSKLFKTVAVASLLTASCAWWPESLRGQSAAHLFSTPYQAVEALSNAVNQVDRAGFATCFGPNWETLVNPDAVQGSNDLRAFTAAFNAAHQLVRDSATCMTLEVGTQAWPMPIPLVSTGGGWQFDTRAGLEELINRRVGRNELDVLRVLRAYVQAQRNYASQDRDGDEVLEYAQRGSSSPGKMDGLYWPPELTGEISPLGPLFAYAQSEGYAASKPEDRPRPFHGYFFKILKKQGKHAPGGQYDYVINGNMIGGFALAAWPASYDESGVMTFIVNQQGRVHQRDLGIKTPQIVRKMSEYDPDAAWQISPD